MADRRPTVQPQGATGARPPSRPRMQRGVSQLLFNYLPGRTVDWEDGLAIVQLGTVRLSASWESARTAAVLDEVSDLLDRWRARGGTVDPRFPNPREAGRFTIGAPEAIEAHFLETALVCARCSRLVFLKANQLTVAAGRRCPSCGAPRLRQIPHVFVHGCGELVPVQEWLPGTKKNSDGSIEAVNRPLRCPRCGPSGELFLPARSERVKDMAVVCRKCDTQVIDRFTARCHRCLKDIARRRPVSDTPLSADSATNSGDTLVTRIAMRMTRYSASDTYYPQTVTTLRLDRPTVSTTSEPEIDILRRVLPSRRRPAESKGSSEGLMALVKRLKDAEAAGDSDKVAAISKMISVAALRPQVDTSAQDDAEENWSIADRDIERAVSESLAFRQNVNSRSATAVAAEAGGATGNLVRDIEKLCRRLGIREMRLVEDLPVITATYGYTRRSFEPTYQELGSAALPTQVRPFSSLDDRAARRLGQPELKGTIPIVAREAEHEGLFLALDQSRVLRWLSANGISLSSQDSAEIVAILRSLEQVDRYYDDIWKCSIRRYVFGLIHTLSHVAMRAASRFAGVERTSISEYIFLPLLGTVIFDNSSNFRLGGIESMVRHQLAAFLECLSDAALDCLYDPDCIDHRGACHGCVHSPEISCRVFNHGLSRSFLLGGHAPWSDVASEQQIVGYWQVEP
jgi:DNA-directed RNA polymerase subunit RPC12/RpoP